MQYLIGYDIENTKNRTKLFEKLKDFGLKPVQKSLFYGELSNAEKLSVKIFLKKYCLDGDKAIITAASLKIEDTIGYEKDDFTKKEFEIL